MTSYNSLSGNYAAADDVNTRYNPRASHSRPGSYQRSRSEAAADRVEMGNLTDEISLLSQEKLGYDPTSRSGRPSYATSRPSSPMLNPQITVTDPEYGSGPRSLPGSSAPSPAPRGRSHRGHSAGPSRWNKFLARFRLVLICVSVVASGAILGCNAVILATYNAHKDAGRWMDRASSDERVWWSAWPEEGVDLVPIDAYLGLAAVSVIVMAAFLISSSHTSFRYLSAGVCRTLIVAIVVGVLLVAWVLLSVFLQFEAIGSSGKHSFRTWACSHEDQDLYKMDGFQFTSLCTEANFSRYGGLVNCAVCGLIFFTILLSCGANRRSRSYQRIERSNNAWMPKWGRSN